MTTETLMQPCYFPWFAVTKAAKGSDEMYWSECIYFLFKTQTLHWNIGRKIFSLVLHLCLSFRNLTSFLASPLGDAVRRASTFMTKSLALWREKGLTNKLFHIYSHTGFGWQAQTRHTFGHSSSSAWSWIWSFLLKCEVWSSLADGNLPHWTLHLRPIGSGSSEDNNLVVSQK